MTPDDLGRRSDIDAIDALVNVRDMEIVDIGCGEGRLARALAERGANVLGLEPDPVQAAKNRTGEPIASVTLIEAGAETIPLEDAAADGVIFLRSLHHVPIRNMPAALKEARRVLKPKGFLLVIEPEATSPFSRLMQPFHDERKARAAAQAAVEKLVPTCFARHRRCYYASEECFVDFDAFAKRMVGASYNRIAREGVDAPRVRRLFEAGWAEGQYRFAQSLRADLLIAD